VSLKNVNLKLQKENEMVEFNPVQTSPFDKKTKIKLHLWHLINITLFRWTFFFMRKYRVFLLRLFGAKIDWTCSIDRTVTIDGPWFLTMGKLSSLGENAWLRCRAPVTIGEKCCIGKDVCIMTGSHKLSSPRFELITDPVTIGDCVWIATRSFVHKGTCIGDGAVVSACAVVSGNVEPWSVVGGNPAKFIKKRVISC